MQFGENLKPKNLKLKTAKVNRGSRKTPKPLQMAARRVGSVGGVRRVERVGRFPYPWDPLPTQSDDNEMVLVKRGDLREIERQARGGWQTLHTMLGGEKSGLAVIPWMLSAIEFRSISRCATAIITWFCMTRFRIRLDRGINVSKLQLPRDIEMHIARMLWNTKLEWYVLPSALPAFTGTLPITEFTEDSERLNAKRQCK